MVDMSFSSKTDGFFLVSPKFKCLQGIADAIKMVIYNAVPPKNQRKNLFNSVSRFAW